MRGQASVPVRLTRMERRQGGGSLTTSQITELAAEYGLHPEEVRREVRLFTERIATYGRESMEVTIHRLAAEFGLDPEQLRAEAEQMAVRWEHKR